MIDLNFFLALKDLVDAYSNAIDILLYADKSLLSWYNQITVSTAKRLASLYWYLIASTINYTINGYEIACIWNSKYIMYMYVWSKQILIVNFCFLLTLNCENLAKQLLPLAISWIDICPSCFVFDLSNTIFCSIGSALTKNPVASQIWTYNSKRLAYTLTA